MSKSIVPRLYNMRDVVKLFVTPPLDPSKQYETVNAIVLAVIWDEGQFLYCLGVELVSVPILGHSTVTVSYENILGRADKLLN